LHNPPRRAAHCRRFDNRLEAFSDGVFAIAITLLVLEIPVPEAEHGGLADALLDQWPSRRRTAARSTAPAG
jgi:uncharacterized membrane protein